MKKNKKQNYIDKYELVSIIPLIILVLFLPFIIRLQIIPLEGPFYEYWRGERVNFDFFTYYKKIFIYLITIWTILHTFFFTKKIKITKAYYFIGGFSLLVILSTIFSDYPQIALHGFNERHEGMWVVLSYMILIFCTINLINTEKQIRYIIYSLGISGGIISIITIFQFFGMDIFDTDFAKRLMISSEILNQVKEFNIRLGEGYAYGVFYNTNYLGGYMSFYSPLMFGYVMFSKQTKEKLIFGILFILSILALAFSRSEAGVLGTISAIILMLTFIYIRHLLQNKEKKEYAKVLFTRLVPILLAIVIVPLSFSYLPMERNPLERIRNEAIVLLTPNREKIDYREIGPVNNIRQIDDRNIELTIYNTTTRLSVDEKMNLRLYDSSGEILFEQQINPLEDASYRIESLENYLCYINIKSFDSADYYGISYYYNDNWDRLNFFVNRNEINLATPNYKIIDISKIEAKSIGFQGKGNLGSGRGYIWSRSFPLIIDNLIIGSGQDTFIVEFPQFDILGKQREGFNQYFWWILTDKPHSTYLQIGIQSGGISLILILIGLTMLSIKKLKKFILYNDKLSLIMISSVFGWAISSIFNDSIIGITPIIMIIIGISIWQLEDFKIKGKGGKLDAK